MLQQAPIAGQIIGVVKSTPDCTLEELTRQLPEIHWSEVFFEVERLRRWGQLVIIQNGSGTTTALRIASNIE